MLIELSPHELQRFGVSAARCFLEEPGQMRDVDAFCTVNAVRMAIIRCHADLIDVAQTIEAGGGALMDCLVYYKLSLGTEPTVAQNASARTRPYEARDQRVVADIAATAFEGYFGHYHADPRLDKRAADETYRDWACNSCSPESAIVAEDAQGEVVGFASLRKTSDNVYDAALFAVSPAARRKGIFTLLLQAAAHWAWERGAELCTYSTQITNVAAHRAVVNNGFVFDYALYTFHKWYD